MLVILKKSHLIALIPFLIILCGCSRQTSNSISGTVIRIVDGDTISVLDANNVQHRIRLKGIDAPERTQAFYQVSRDNLAALTFQKEVRVDYTKVDRWGREVGTVWIGGDDACLAQIKAGLAWHFKRYQKEQSQSDREEYANAEEDARSHKSGIWKDLNPTPPWDFQRHKTGSEDEANSEVDSSSLLQSSPTPADSNKDTKTQPIVKQNSPVTSTTLKRLVTTPSEEDFIRGNKRSRIYHWPGCENYDDIARHNRVRFRNRQEAEEAGYRSATNCR